MYVLLMLHLQNCLVGSMKLSCQNPHFDKLVIQKTFPTVCCMVCHVMYMSISTIQ